MYRTAFIVTSVIDPSTEPLSSYSTRSVFSAAERFRQTQYTIASLDTIAPAGSTIFLLDASTEPTEWQAQLTYQKNLVFVNLKEECPDLYRTIRTYPNKSYCECLMLIEFINRYRETLRDYTHFIKLSGRYFIDGSFHLRELLDAGPRTLAFKRPISWEWKDWWGYEMVDRRAIQGDNLFRQYSSVLFGWGHQQTQTMRGIFMSIAALIQVPENHHYDNETLLYYYTRPYASSILETDWMTYGWGGPTGTFLRA